MLTSLAIRDVVLIEALDLEFGPGLAALTGETGAGKSILLDALGLALGQRAEAGLVRQGAAQASVVAGFELLPDHPARALLAENDVAVEPGEPLLIRRVLRADGGSRAFVADQPASAALLRALGATLVEIHGQHDDRGLLNARGHRALLDAFARVDLAAVADAHARWRRPSRRWRRRAPTSTPPTATATSWSMPSPSSPPPRPSRARRRRSPRRARRCRRAPASPRSWRR